MKLCTYRSVLYRCLIGLLGSCTLVVSSGALAEPAGFPCSDWGSSVLVDGRQRTIVGGVAADNRVLEWDGGHAHYGDFAVARLRKDGSFDPSFGDRGSVILDDGDFDSVADMALGWDGIVVGGTTQQRDGDRTGPSEAVVFKLDDRGNLVESFGEDGLARLGLGGSEVVERVAAGWFGDVYVAGTVEHADTTHGFIARLDRHGEPDLAFGAGGLVHLGDLANMQHVHGMRVVHGALMVAGQRSVEGTTEAVAARLDLRGRLTRRFGDRGIASVEIPNAVPGQGTAFFSRLGATAVSLQAASDTGSRIATVTFDRRGRVLRGAEGYVTVLDAPTGSQDSVSAGAFVWHRTMYLAGATYPDDFATGDAFLARGDTSGGAYDVTSVRFDLEYAAFNDVAATRSALTVVGWNFGEADDTLPPSDALLVRYGHDGSLDSTFGDGGVVMLDFMRGQAVCGPRVEED